MDLPLVKARVILALEAIKSDKKLSLRAIAKLYNVYPITLYRRHASQPIRRNTSLNSRKLTKLKEEAIIQYVLKLRTRSFPPRLRNVEEIANQLLHVRDTPPVGVN